MAIRDRHRAADGPPRDREPAAVRTPDRGELSAPGGDQRRRRRRRRILLGTLAPLVLVVLYFGISYANYMLEPTSETFSERSAEWVRDDVPFGNWIVDTAERSHGEHAPQGRSGTQAPAQRRAQPGTACGPSRQARRLQAATDQAGVRHAAAR